MSATADALEITLDVLLWQLSEERWAAVAGILTDMEAAVAAGEPQLLTGTTVRLELIAPLRITLIGAQPTIPLPLEVRDRLNRLVHALGGPPPSSPGEPTDKEGGSDTTASP